MTKSHYGIRLMGTIIFSLSFTVFVEAETRMEPSLGAVFPMVVEGEAVKTAQNILLNKTLILPAGTTLRCCFQMPDKDSSDLRKKQKKNSIERNYSRKPIDVTGRDDYDPYREAVKDRAFKTVWDNPDLFRGYFFKISHTRYYVVYELPGSSSPAFAQFFFPEGLFLASDGEHILVLAVEEGSRGADSGFAAGDKIHELEGLKLEGDLKRFLTHYLSSLKKNKLTGKALNFEVFPEGGEETVSRAINLPLSIHSDPFAPIGE